MAYQFNQKVLFKHCDPAGIVFYPRYFEMINDVVEGFFSDELNMPFEEMLKTHGVPTAAIECQFTAPSFHGDELIIAVHCTRVGNSSVSLLFEASCQGETRFKATSTLVYIELQGKPCPWPDALRDRLASFLEVDSV